MVLSEWNEVGDNDNRPECFKRIEMTDGYIVDTGYSTYRKWYLDNHHMIMRDITHWRYI